jgi:peptide-methionine (S)-S-oxide reductase
MCESKEKATFAAGCFWGIQDAFDAIPGVLETTVGYTGGRTKNPTYESVCSDSTGHSESVEVVFDPSIVSYDDLLSAFWEMHNPTTMNRQGPDVGSQYRSAIFFHSSAQEAAASRSKEERANSGKYQSPIVTEIVPAETFWPAEEYHQKYFQKTGHRVC